MRPIDTPDRVEAVHEVRRSVERIDQPTGVEILAAGLFAEHGQTGVAGEQLPDRLLAREVGFAHPVARRLLPHAFEMTEVPAHDVAARVRGAVCRRQELAVVERGHARPAISASASSPVPAATSWRARTDVVGRKIASLRVAHDCTRFDTREVPREVVPRRVEPARVEQPVEAADRDLAQTERGRAERTKLLPGQPRLRGTGDVDHRLLDRLRRRRVDAYAVAERALPAYCSDAHARRLVHDEAGQRAVGIERADRSGPIREVGASSWSSRRPDRPPR